MPVQTIPDIAVFVEPLLGQDYAKADCWDVVRTLFLQGFGLDLVRDAEQATLVFQEVWYRGDARDALTLVQPWDLFIVANDPTLPVSDHVGVVVDNQFLVHARLNATGVAKERLRLWRPRLLQLARYRELL